MIYIVTIYYFITWFSIFFFFLLQIDSTNKALIENLTLQLSAAAVALHQAQESKGTKPENSAVITGKKIILDLIDSIAV